MTAASIYKDPKPKYIELYSKNPPSIAPKILADIACEAEFSLDNSFENAIPENKIGKVNIKGKNKLKSFWFMVLKPSIELKYPNNNETMVQ